MSEVPSAAMFYRMLSLKRSKSWQSFSHCEFMQKLCSYNLRHTPVVQNWRFILRGKFCCYVADNRGSAKAMALPVGLYGPQSPCSLQLYAVHGCNFNLVLLLENKTDRHQKKNKEKIAACHKYFASLAAWHVIVSKCLILDAIRLKKRKRQQAVFFLFH